MRSRLWDKLWLKRASRYSRIMSETAVVIDPKVLEEVEVLKNTLLVDLEKAYEQASPEAQRILCDSLRDLMPKLEAEIEVNLFVKKTWEDILAL